MDSLVCRLGPALLGHRPVEVVEPGMDDRRLFDGVGQGNPVQLGPPVLDLPASSGDDVRVGLLFGLGQVDPSRGKPSDRLVRLRR